MEVLQGNNRAVRRCAFVRWLPLECSSCSSQVWRDSVRYGKMRKYGKILQKNLFWMNPAFQQALFKIRASCMDLKVMKLHSSTKGVLYTLERFFNAQQVQRGKVMELLKNFWEGVVDTARQSCIATLESLEEGLFGNNSADTNATQVWRVGVMVQSGCRWIEGL